MASRNKKKGNKAKSTPKKNTAQKKAPAKKVVPNTKDTKEAKKAAQMAEAMIAEKLETKDSSPKQIRLVKPKFMKFLGIASAIVLTVLLVDYVVQYINNDYSVAIVNGSRIPRSDFEQRLEEAYGDVIATQLVNELLIEQEASKAEITVSDEDVQEVIDQTEEELGGEAELESALLSNGLTLEVYKRNLRIQLLAEKLVVDEPSEEELKDFFTEYQDVYFEEETSYDDVKDEIKSIYVTQKFNEESALWLSKLQEDADVQNNISDAPSYGIFQITRDLITNLNDRVGDAQDETVDESSEGTETETVEEETGTETIEEGSANE